MRTILDNKKGVLGLDTVKAVILALAMITILAVVSFLVLIPMQNSVESIDQNSIRINNETLGTVNGSAAIPLAGQALYRNCQASSVIVYNSTGSEVIPANNYSVSACTIRSVAPSGYNLTIWNITYTASYDSWNTYNIVNNLTVGSTGFFANSGTFFVLLGVVVLILIIGIVIAAVSRFSGGGIGIGKRGEQSEGI